MPKTTTTDDPASVAFQYTQPPEELLSHKNDMSTPQWQSSPTLSHPSQPMNVTTTPTPTPPPATPSHPIAPLIPIPKWTHPSSSHFATDDIWPTNLIDIIRAIKNMPPRQPTPPEFSFDLSLEAAERNYMVLMHKYNGSLAASLESQRDSTVGYGSEFRDEATLSHLFARHPNWNRMIEILRHGSKWPLEPLDEDKRQADVAEALAFGNHKGASLQPELLKKLVSKDVHYGYCLPLPLAKATKIPSILIAPMNIQKQNTINEYGQIAPKDRLTHDQSYKWSSGTSVNSRVITEELLPCMFGACIRRIVNWTVSARRLFPNLPILASKIDYKSAFRRMHLNAETASQTCTMLPEFGLLLNWLRLSFGGKPCPYMWGVFSESICDLANAILFNDDWDPFDLLAPNQPLVPPRTLLDDDIPFCAGAELIVEIPIDPRGSHDVYIDDVILLTVDIPGTDNAARGQSASLLAIDATARPNHPNEPIPRESMDARDKLFAEAGLTEIKMILGWEFDFHRLKISLPDNKFIAWTTDVNNLLDAGTTTAKELESTIGRLGHLALVVPGVYHFLSRLRELQRSATHRRTIRFSDICRDDLLLMLRFLDVAKNGISMNLVAFRKPTHVYRSDSCPFGLGGYSDQGFAWRFEIPEELRFRASNNLLEYIASIITPWVDMLAGRLNRGDCALSMTDSSTSAGWLRKTNFREFTGVDSDPIQASVRIDTARHHATLFLENGIKEYSQWFPGQENNVADALSRDFDRSDDDLTLTLRSTCPPQLPQHFQIVQLPNEISSWLTSLLLRLPVKEQLREAHTRTKLGRGDGSTSTSTPLDSPTTPTSNPSQDHNGTGLSEPLPWLSGRDDIQARLMTNWLLAQSKIPSRMYLRPSGKTADPTQPRTTTYSLASFYNDNSALSKTKTPKKNNRRPSPPVSSPKLPSAN